MKFLGRLVDAHFRTDEQGRLLFRPRFGKCRVVPGEDDVAFLRRQLTAHYIGVFAGAFVIGALRTPLILSTVFFVALSLIIWEPVRARVRGWKPIGERLTFRGWIAEWKVARSMRGLRLEFWLYTLLTCGAIAAAVHSDETLLRFGSLAIAVFFGGYAGLCLATLLQRFRSR